MGEDFTVLILSGLDGLFGLFLLACLHSTLTVELDIGSLDCFTATATLLKEQLLGLWISRV